MKQNPSSVTPSTITAMPQATQPSHEEIARRAYELWLQDGAPTGRAVYHWHEAERQLQKATQNLQPSTNQTSPKPNDHSLASLTNDCAPYDDLEKGASLSSKVERSRTKPNIKSPPYSGESVKLVSTMQTSKA